MKTRIIPIVFLSLLPGLVHALGLGPITTQSYLSQPFSARIEILSATVPELDSLIVILGDTKAFQRSGLELTRDIKKLQFKIISDENGKNYIQVTSQDPVRDPVLSFVVEANWHTGQMTHAYTVLLDPPFYAAAERSRLQAKKETRPLPATPEPPVITQEPPRISPGPPAAPVVSTMSAHDWTVAAGDTLGFIANKSRPDASISTDQMMLAILQANPEAFINGNINNIKLGATLRLPDREEIQAIDKQEAANQVKTQYAQWKNTQIATKDITENTTGDSPQPGLRILTPDENAGDMQGESGSADKGGHGIDSLKKELALTAESIESYRTENAELAARLTAAEAKINDLKSELKKGLQIEAPLPIQEEPRTSQYGPTVAGDNLWTIANKVRPDISISTNQMMLALLRANPGAFIHGNINQLKSGVLLHVPDNQDIQSISKEQAAAEVNSHYTLWKRRE